MSTLNIIIETETVVRLLALGFTSFLASMLLTPVFTTLAYKYQWWKRPREKAVTGEAASVYRKLHAAKHERHIPTMAGMIVVLAVAFVTVFANLSRAQTWLPIAAMVGAGMIGLIDDVINIRGNTKIAGLRAKAKMISISLVALIGGWWLWDKLDVSSIHIPFVGAWQIGWLIVPLFVLVVVSTANAVNITDGLDGLAGGLLAISFAAYTIIAFFQQRYGIAGFCLSMVGGLLSYTWFNIYPARFFMGDTGSFAFGTALGVVAMLTDTVVILPIIGVVFVAEAGSSMLQIASKKLRAGRKIFKVAPIHHHFEAMGWPETKVTMRFWIIGQVMAVAGLMVFLLGGKL